MKIILIPNILELHQKLLHQTCPDKTGTYNYHCHLCSKQFKMRGSLMVHLRIAHYGFVQNYVEECDPGNKKRTKSSGNTKSKTNIATHAKITPQNVSVTSPLDKKQWECEICSKTFTTKYFLKKHNRLHTGEMPYCCTLCNKSFTFQQSYHKHMLYHSSEKPYSCNECGRAFKELSTLQNHARIHSGERPFTCETCGKNFRQRISYLVHRRIHTGVMPYKCTACHKSFRYKVSQKSHKCPMNNVGSANEKVSSLSSSEKMTSNLNEEIGSSLDRIVETVQKETLSENTKSLKTSILVSCNPHIEISYNAEDLATAIQNVTPETTVKEDAESGTINPKLELEGTNTILSPIITNVEQLYLNSQPDGFFLNSFHNP